MNTVENATWDVRLQAYDGSNPFVNDVRSKYLKYGSLSVKQIDAVVRAMDREISSTAARSAAADKNFASIAKWLAAVAENVQWPKFHFLNGDEELVLRWKRNGARPGTVDVVTKEKFWNERFQNDAPRWFGRIELDGSLTAGGMLTLDIESMLERIAADPEKAAVEYGRITNKCAFCYRDLNNEVSVELGYGPVCAKRYNLDHKY